MGHRKELKNIAGGIISSFTSRNNDVNGYWELGKMYKLCEDYNLDSIRLDLLNLQTKPQLDELAPLARMWNAKLKSHLGIRNIPITWLSSATILTKFNQEYVEEYHFWGAKLGNHCTCTCEIIADNSRVYSMTSGTNCKPHNPEKESRSTRRNEF